LGARTSCWKRVRPLALVVVPGVAGLVGVPAVDAVPDAITDEVADAVVVFQVPGRFGMMGITEGVAVAPGAILTTVVPVG
jgi:hypothetical protein